MKISFESKHAKKVDTIVVFLEKGGKLSKSAKELDTKTKGAIKRAIKSEGFEGKNSEFITIVSPKGISVSRIIVAGMGIASKITNRCFEILGSSLLNELNKKSTEACLLIGFDINGVKEADIANELAMGLTLNSYRFNKYFTKTKKEKDVKLKSVTFVVNELVASKKIYTNKKKLADAVFWARDLVTEAPNVLYPESYADIIKKKLEPLGVNVKILGRAQLKKLGMNAMISVGFGSDREEKLVVMEYKGAAKTKKPVALVGKGITFDTGGISLKPGAGMWDMKFDMGGSAAVVGAMKSIAGRKANANVIAVVALAENMPSARATRPGDVVKSMSGQTIEIQNTDAEGRMVLCDALWYVQEKYKPTHIVDLATLTGACLVALGHEYAAAFSNDEKMPQCLMKTGEEVGDNVWHMPMCDNWNKEMNSKIADMKNIGGKFAGSATAAHFLKRFIKKGVKWTHLDIAGTAWRDKASVSNPAGATGFGVRLLDRYVQKHFEK